MRSLSKRAFLIAFAAAMGLLLAVTTIAVAQRSHASVAHANSLSSTPLASSLAVFSRQATASDKAPEAIAAELQNLVSASEAKAEVGGLNLAATRRMLEIGRTMIYAAPTDTGAVCYAVTAGPSGCDDNENFVDGPMSVGVFDADTLGAGEPMAVYGLIKNDVRSVTVTDSGTHAFDATVGGNAFFVRLSESTTWPTAVTAKLVDGSRVDVTLDEPPPMR